MRPALERLKVRARAIKRETYALYLACRDPRTPWYARLFAGAVVAYALSPLDLIPDFIPVLGQADDFLVVLAAVGLLLVAVPRERFEEALARAERAQDARRSAGARRADALPRRREG